MDQAQIVAQLSEILGEVLDAPDLVLTPETSAADVAHWDSMTNITFVVEVESRFGIKFKTAEIEEMRNVGDMIAMILEKRSK
ncbi:acyl carrier protein [Rhizorhabdus argentea]|uniref:acyl carrier protein n=1 Tax=Rhizorhabdus argentea TaxID=1387174 RepID=UPI0030EBE9D9